MAEAREERLRLIQKRTELRAMGKGLKVAKVWGPRLLIETVRPWTEMDEYVAKGLVVPDDARAAREASILPSTGIVMMTGTEVDTSFVEVGDMVLFSRFAGSDHVIDSQPIKIITMDEVLAVLEENVTIVEVEAREPK